MHAGAEGVHAGAERMGKQGWTTATLSALSAADLKSALETAWAHAVRRRTAKW